jgi:hypothetical protein
VNEEGKGRVGQYIMNALDKVLRGRRLRIVGAARDMLMAPDQETDIVGAPLPVNPEAVAALRDRLAHGRPGQRTGRMRSTAPTNALPGMMSTDTGGLSSEVVEFLIESDALCRG